MPLQNMTADALDGKEPQRQNNAKMYINGVTGADVLTLAMESVPLPKINNNVLELPYLNETRKYAGKPAFQELTAVFKGLIEASVYPAVLGWRVKVYDPKTGKIGKAVDYKKTGYIQLYGPDGSDQTAWDLFGIWPSEFDPGDTDQSSDEYIRINLTLVIDKAIQRN